MIEISNKNKEKYFFGLTTNIKLLLNAYIIRLLSKDDL
jgi:hypothetical protein